jgi:thiol-disulfide isomerase/thioredoxin
MAPLRFLRRGLLLAALVAGGVVVSTPTDATAQGMRARPWLGISMDGEAGNVVRVKHVVRSSPADKAGLRLGDRIDQVDGAQVASATEVTRAVGKHGVGDAVSVRIQRNGKPLTMKVTLASFPSPEAMLRMDHLGTFAPAWKGVEPVSGMVPRSIDQLRGRVVVLDFWATWCGPCRMVAPKLGDLQQRYGAQGLSVVGISTEDPEAVATFAQRTGMRYAIGVDRQTETAQAYTVASLPTMFVIDKRGVVRQVEVGYDPSQDASREALVQKLLAEPAPGN